MYLLMLLFCEGLLITHKGDERAVNTDGTTLAGDCFIGDICFLDDDTLFTVFTGAGETTVKSVLSCYLLAAC